MLRIVQNRSAASAKSYYSKADYYGQESPGRWGGKAAERLGLSGQVTKEAFDAMCDNLQPGTNQRLTARTDTDRTVGYDFVFSVPKGISVLYSFNQDERILGALRASVDETMRDLEAEAKTRVRGRGRDSERVTGNLCWAEFIHSTTRPIDGVPDPDWHIHAFVFNATLDQQEQRFKAAQFRDLKRDAPYFEAAFEARLARRLNELGYRTERRGKGWDLVGIPKILTAKFSRRTQQIEELAHAKGILDPDEKSALGAKTREKKAQAIALPELRRLWWERLTKEEAELLDNYRPSDASWSPPETRARETLQHAIDHGFERSSVLPTRTLLASALKHGIGDVSPDALSGLLKNCNVIEGKYRGRDMVTTRHVLEEETAMLQFARQGKGKVSPLNSGWRIQRDWLNAGQRAAVQHILNSRSVVTLVRGRAGTGKTTLLKEAVEGIEAAGHKVFTFAPSSNASRNVLRSEGFDNATTVAELLVNEKLQREAAGQVLLIDEAGLLGTKTLKQVFDLAERNGCRVILSGDYSQHGSVERGAALRLLEQEAGLKSSLVTENQRQEPLEYRAIVDQVASGELKTGLERMRQLGFVREAGDQLRNELIAKDYADCVERKQSVLTVCPTHAEGQRIASAIRQELKARKLLDENEQSMLRLLPLHLSEAERKDVNAYEPGDILVFHQNAPGHRKGDRVRLSAPMTAEVAKHAAHFQVFRESRIMIAPREKVRATRGGSTKDGKHKLLNGVTYTVAAVLPNKDLLFDNGWVVDKDFGFLQHAYVSTSHASQGLTLNEVLIAEPSSSFGAASAEQLYVSLSRGKKAARIYTDSMDALIAAVHRSSDRLAASELLSGTPPQPMHRRIQETRNKIMAAQLAQAPERTYEYVYGR